MNRGRHASASASSFYRDLVMMVIGILLVGAAVFLLLYLFSGDPDPVAAGTTTSTSTQPSNPDTTEQSTTTTLAETPTTAGPATSTTVPVRPPDEVRVVVLNSIGLDGAAGRKTQQLADAGYQTQQAGDLEAEQDPSRIWYREGFAAEAN
ncbi:MAG: LytR C-terminal domain-containing protein, partial [Acidimicrobiia bacterium]